MSKLEVLSNEPMNPETFNDTHISYETTVLGKNMKLVYYFIDNKLIRARYLFVTKNKDEYEKIYDILSKKYGRSRFSMDFSPFEYSYNWEDHKTIVLLLPGKDRDCTVDYISKKFKYLKTKMLEIAQHHKDKEIMNSF